MMDTKGPKDFDDYHEYLEYWSGLSYEEKMASCPPDDQAMFEDGKTGRPKDFFSLVSILRVSLLNGFKALAGMYHERGMHGAADMAMAMVAQGGTINRDLTLIQNRLRPETVKDLDDTMRAVFDDLAKRGQDLVDDARTIRNTGDDFICGLCGGSFTKGRDDREAHDEAKAAFDKHGVPYNEEEMAFVCEDCYKRLTSILPIEEWLKQQKEGGDDA